MRESLPVFILMAGIGQLGVLTASALVPIRLHWRTELQVLPRLHRQLYWVYGGYVVLSITAFGLISVFHSTELSAGSGLARGFCLYVAIFWGLRFALQAVLAAKAHLTAWWLKLGYHTLTVLFVSFTIIYIWAAFMPVT